MHLVRRDPHALGWSHTRWTLKAILATCGWLRLTTRGGLHRLLKRLRIVWKRARASVSSPDPHYEAKLVEVARVRALAEAQPGRIVAVYLDEVTLYRQPTLASTYEALGAGRQARARLSHRSNTRTRVVAALEARTGRVVYRRAGKITLATLVAFYQELRAAFPEAARIYVVQDNWPLHAHPDVLAGLEPQETRWLPKRSPSWPTEPSAAARRRWGSLALPIQIVPLPSYASWCNPIEKLWNKLRQEVTHLHPWAEDLPRLRQETDRFLDSFAAGSQDLLRYVGCVPSK